MKNLLFGLTIALLLVVPVQGQSSYPDGELFGGFSYLKSDDVNFLGWQANVSGNVTRHFGVVLDLGGQYKNIAGLKVQAYQLLIGPRFIARGEKVTGFVHTLAGYEQFRARGTSTGIALALGGGMDVNMNDRIAIRVFQIDVIPTRFSGGWSSDIRVGAGVVFKWGHR